MRLAILVIIITIIFLTYFKPRIYFSEKGRLILYYYWRNVRREFIIF